MPDPDSWLGVLLCLFQFLAALSLLWLGMLYAGVTIETATQKEILRSGVGISLATACALLFCLPFGALSVSLGYTLVRALALLSQPGLLAQSAPTPLYYLILVLGCLALLCVSIAYAILLPLSWGRARSNRLSRPLRFFASFCSLLMPLARFVTMPARRILLARGAAGEIGSYTEQDLLDMVETVEEHSLIDPAQREMIGNIFELDDVTAADVMTHRTEMEAVPATATVDDIINVAVEHGYSRIPVYNGTLDNITGIACVKDLLPYVGKGVKGIDLFSLFRAALFVPESRLARELLFDFKQNKIQLAVVVDEYGGTAGIVTMEDILESIVGDIADEYDEEDEPRVVPQPDGSLVCDGYAEVEEVYEALARGEVPDDIENDTIGGLLTALLARIPRAEELAATQFDGLELTALCADERRITSVRVCRIDDGAASADL